MQAGVRQRQMHLGSALLFVTPPIATLTSHGNETSQTKEHAEGGKTEAKGPLPVDGSGPFQVFKVASSNQSIKHPPLYGCFFCRLAGLPCYLGANCVDGECPVASDIIHLCGACLPPCGNSANHSNRAGFYYGYAITGGVNDRATGNRREA